MPKKRQKRRLILMLKIRWISGVLRSSFSTAHKIHKHSHDWHQLIYASRGVMAVNTATGSWVVPSRRAVWVPAGIEHEVEMSASVSLRTLYLRTGLLMLLPKDCCVVNVSPLLRELILRTIEIGMLDRSLPFHRHLIDVILDQFPRTRDRAAEASHAYGCPGAACCRGRGLNPGEANSLDQLARNMGASKRTIEDCSRRKRK